MNSSLFPKVSSLKFWVLKPINAKSNLSPLDNHFLYEYECVTYLKRYLTYVIKLINL